MKREKSIIETSAEKLLSISTLFKGKISSSSLAPCRVGMRDYHIFPDGDVFVCTTYPPIGNVLNQSAYDIWNGMLAKGIRKKTIECVDFGTQRCASSCFDHRTPTQEIKRAMLIIRQKM
ncbi:MAG: SPASM domain-containing protein [Methylococcaceae bacterium]|nr:SPASM domain-containing protein [Methylococcaceae bacterium]